ncbi:MAG: cytochrome bd-I oxidase subunit CydX [Paraglaciecola sp.]|nr:cytochrome bd-I oxidase subunit CydX [Paraglaciecola sp.]MDP5031586.1 cytochrome bd-I oxidase subunit CydX [Paraglaciecola sp.]MDP5133344.1 cytochrome bd-I oxidase subunit CydX [Paraglaciecola sp.]
MWYFTWILGVLLACAFGIINVMWLENSMDFEDE